VYRWKIYLSASSDTYEEVGETIRTQKRRTTKKKKRELDVEDDTEPPKKAPSKTKKHNCTKRGQDGRDRDTGETLA
jgi:hypothetical protein